MILFDHVVQILRGAHLRSLRQQTVSFHLPHGAVRGGIPIERDRLRWLALMFDCLAKKGLAAVTSRFALSMKPTVWPARFYRPVEIDPLATDLQIGLVNTTRLSPGVAKWF